MAGKEKESIMKILVVEDKEKNIEAAKNQLASHDVTIITGYDQAHKMIKAKLDLDELGTILNNELPSGWKTVDEKKVFMDGNGIWDLVSPEGKKTSYWDAPKDVERIYKVSAKKATHPPFDVVLTDVMFSKGGDECMSAEGKELAKRQGEMPYGPIVALRAIQAGVKMVGIITQGSHHDDPFIFAFDGLYGFKNGDTKVVCTNGMQTETGVKNWAKLLEKLMSEENE